MEPATKQLFDQLVQDNPVVLFMKGEKDMPMCGFSAQVVKVLNQLGTDFEAINVLENEAIRQGVKEYSNWPTIPQLYIGGEFMGGCDITIEMYQSGELQEALAKVTDQAA